MIESEAKTKWCPYSLKYHSSGGAYNRSSSYGGGVNIEPANMCLASGCMAWRWVPDPLIKFVADGKTIVIPGGEDDHGYCGQAGPLP